MASSPARRYLALVAGIAWICLLAQPAIAAGYPQNSTQPPALHPHRAAQPVILEFNATALSVTVLVNGNAAAAASIEIAAGNQTVASASNVTGARVFYLSPGGYTVTATMGRVAQSENFTAQTGKNGALIFDFLTTQTGTPYSLADYLLIATALAGLGGSVAVWGRLLQLRSRGPSPQQYST